MSATFQDAATNSFRPGRPSVPRFDRLLDSIRVKPATRPAEHQAILDELDAMLAHESSRDGYVFRPTSYAYEHARRWLIISFSVTDAVLPRPELTPDGDGGIDVEWINGDREMSLSCRARPTLKGNYIYWQDDETYDAQGVSSLLLKDRLEWLVS